MFFLHLNNCTLLDAGPEIKDKCIKTNATWLKVFWGFPLFGFLS